MESFQIVRANANDAEKLQKISQKTFFETFEQENTAENMQNYLSNNFSLEKLLSELRHQQSEFYFLFSGNEIIAYLKINFGDAQVEKQLDNALEIERIYVLKEFQGKNAGKILMEKAEKIAREKNCLYVWLGVWEKNFKAIRFYQNFGFVEFDKHLFILGDDAQTDIMMKKYL
jgi:ribosomal protein S18 acetylase RimI-like enzyme